MSSQLVRINATDGKDFEAYETIDGKGPGLILLSEMFNANDNIRSVSDGWAKRGFVCIAPDLYWRTRPRAYFGYDDPDRDEARVLYQALDREVAADDVASCAEYLKRHPFCDGRVFAVGFCLGGELALLSAMRGDIDAASIYYGTNLMKYAGKLDGLKVPTLLHFAERDEHVPLSVADAFAAEAETVAQLEVHVYPGVEHAFARPNRPQYDARSTDLADARTLQWFK